jgi:hypothetical protein
MSCHAVLRCAVSCCAVHSYWQELIDLEKRYAGDLEELQSRLQVQAHAANRDKVQSYLDRTSRVRVAG